MHISMRLEKSITLKVFFQDIRWATRNTKNIQDCLFLSTLVLWIDSVRVVVWKIVWLQKVITKTYLNQFSRQYCRIQGFFFFFLNRCIIFVVFHCFVARRPVHRASGLLKIYIFSLWLIVTAELSALADEKIML